MATTNINVFVDSAINMFPHSAVNHNGIPFEIKSPIPNADTKAALDEYEEMKKNPDKYTRYKSFDDILDEVFADT